MKNKFLLGATANNDLVFGEYELTERNGFRQFSASFDVVRPFREDDFDAEEYAESELECYDKAQKYDLCERYDCSPSELVDYFVEKYDGDPREAMDCSLFPEGYEIDGTNWYFESMCCGQHDIKKEEKMKVYTNKAAFDMLYTLWDTFHLKEVNDNCLAVLNQFLHRMQKYKTDEGIEKWVRNFIEKNL